MCIPSIRCIGNIASSCDGTHVPSLLSTTSTTTLTIAPRQYTTQSIATSLATLIQRGTLSPSIASQAGDASSVLASEAAWATSTLLCDAGLPPPHPSTVSADELVPSLCRAVTSGYAKLELKREATCALWNAVASPPPPSSPILDDNAMMKRNPETTIHTRDCILHGIVQTDGMIQSLTELIRARDADAVVTSVKLINAIHRRFIDSNSSTVVAATTSHFYKSHLRMKFDEAGIVDALEGVCDNTSIESFYGKGINQWSGNKNEEEAAEIAADLIDDFYEDTNGEEDEDVEVLPTTTPFSSMSSDLDNNNEMRYSFGVDGSSSSSFNFGGGGIERGSVSSFGSGGTAGGSGGGGSGSGMGRGRGRGNRNVPAWMQQQQQNI
uniref:Uncharacterized protein n=1 Tax=Ditylum brightwellii TaxID=49249 RepID=A0A7S4W8T7_9STRA